MLSGATVNYSLTRDGKSTETQVTYKFVNKEQVEREGSLSLPRAYYESHGDKKTMKQIILILLLLLSLYFSTSAQEEFVVVTPVAVDRLFWLSSPRKPVQVFVAEMQNGTLPIKIIYFPKSDGRRGGLTEFVDPKTLNNKTRWKVRLRAPSGEETSYCKADNYFRTSRSKIKTDEEGEPVLRFRSTQFDAFLQFRNLAEMSCKVLDSGFPTPEP